MSKPQGLQGWDDIRDYESKHRKILQCSPTQSFLALKHIFKQRGKHLIFRSRLLDKVFNGCFQMRSKGGICTD